MNLNTPSPPKKALDALSDDELYTALEAVALYRNLKQSELSAKVLSEWQAIAPDPCALEAHTPEWQLLQAGSLITKFYMELCRRDPSLLSALLETDG